jgi:phosphoribosyl 1,2-cyclic phosphodiesterase
MKLKFLGTRGNIKVRTKIHKMHSSLLVSYYGKKILIDWGEDWLDEKMYFKPNAIIVTHDHPDHSWGLKNGVPCPVYATKKAWEGMENFKIQNKEEIKVREPIDICEMEVEAFPVDHSSRAPAVGYRITAGKVSIFYVPDVVYIPNRNEALTGVKVYIGDGATIKRSMVRKIDNNLIGHVPVSTQLTWCKKEKIPFMIITHCGSEIVKGKKEEIQTKLEKLAEERGIDAWIAYDGMERILK